MSKLPKAVNGWRAEREARRAAEATRSIFYQAVNGVNGRSTMQLA